MLKIHLNPEYEVIYTDVDAQEELVAAKQGKEVTPLDT
jgi:hypothetical protein